MRTVFFGTPQWAVPSLEALLASDIEVAAVVTNPDRPAGRGMELRPSPVKERALRAGLEVLQPQRARDPEFHDALERLAPDVSTVVAYGKILPASLLEIPPLGFVNLHFSLLPEYRGAAPVQRAVMDGRSVSGISIMVLTEGMDEGPVLVTTEEPIRDDDTAGSLGDRLAAIGSGRLVDALVAYGAGAPHSRRAGSRPRDLRPQGHDRGGRHRLDSAFSRDPQPGARPESCPRSVDHPERQTAQDLGDSPHSGTRSCCRESSMCGTAPSLRAREMRLSS